MSLSDQVAARLRKHRLIGNTIQIYIRDSELHGFVRQQRLLVPTNHDVEIARIAMNLFRRNYNWEKPVRSIGVRAMQLDSADTCRQISIFDPDFQTDEKTALAKTVDTLRARYGKEIICRGAVLDTRTDLLPKGQAGWNNGGFSKAQ